MLIAAQVQNNPPMPALNTPMGSSFMVNLSIAATMAQTIPPTAPHFHALSVPFGRFFVEGAKF